ncbi:cellulose synthase operon protein YhjQ/BcsQ [Candidatus Parabeggiatoa sp. HSG14]|uniref:GumC family protein n=1 Tax=Candidatus Parabeggiatoa sp. HSG14 TaxID=3055593 RepID=UPI0032E4E785
MAFIIFIVISAIGFPVALKIGKVTYVAISVVLVSPKFVSILESEKGMNLNRQDYLLYIKQQTSMIKRHDVLEEVLNIHEVWMAWSLPDETKKEALIRLNLALSASNNRGSPFISATLTTNSKPHDEFGLDKILSAIIKSFLKKTQKEVIFDSSGRIDVLQKRWDELSLFISERRKRRIEIAQELGVTTFKENSLNPYDNILIDTTKAFILDRRQRVEAEARFIALMKKQHEKGITRLDTLANEMVAEDSVLTNFKRRLVEQRTNLLIKTLGLTSKHPTKRRVQKEIAVIDHDIKQATQKLFNEIRARLLEKAKSDIYQAQRIEQALAIELEDQRTQAKHYATNYNEALLLNKEIERVYQLLNKIDDKIGHLTLEATAPGFVRLHTPAKTFPPSGGRKKIVFVFIIIAFGLAIAVPIAIDMLDRRLHTPGEVHKILGFAPMAWILDRHDNGTEQLAIDCLRRMALALERDWHTHETNCFVLTSVKAGGGTTTLTLELAHILSELGVRTLAVELNAFKQDIRYTGGVTPSHGLTALLSPNDYESLSPEMFIVPAVAELPDRLPTGDTPKRHIATYGKLRPLLKQLNAHYDLILVDMPPLLLSADAELLGEIAGAILLVVEAEQVTPGELKRSAHLLERLNPPVIGAILNRVKVFRGGGYFADLLKEYETGEKLQRGWIKRFLWH